MINHLNDSEFTERIKVFTSSLLPNHFSVVQDGNGRSFRVALTLNSHNFTPSALKRNEKM